VVTTRPTLDSYRLHATGRRPLRRLGSGLLTGAAAALAITAAPATASAAETAPSPAAQQAVDTARAQVGKAYEYGAAGPDSFDCSGLTQYAYASAGISLPHSSQGQSEMGTAVARADLRPGDLVFFYEPVSHVGMYVGDGQMVDAGSEETGVAQRTVDMEGYDFARRIG
jgi:cell wall-associated NlpC family hydrolase